MAFWQAHFSESVFVVMGVSRMTKVFKILCFSAAVAGMAISFTGCNSKNWFKASAQENGASKGPLPTAPDATFKDLDGKDVTLSSLKGKVVVLNFWATWCEPCQVEIPWMIELQQKNADKGFTILGAAMDDEGKSVVEPYVQKTEFDVDGQKMKMNYPIVLGTDDIASKFGGLIGLPTTVVITRDGKIAKRFIGLANRDQLEKQVRALL
jgi:cytochrome c biogenesis protein CcmG/thiol:disulfide interchange protein DsbE